MKRSPDGAHRRTNRCAHARVDGQKMGKRKQPEGPVAPANAERKRARGAGHVTKGVAWPTIDFTVAALRRSWYNDSGKATAATTASTTESSARTGGWRRTVVEAALHGISESEEVQRTTGRVPLGRLAQPEEIAALAVFAASARASYLTGVVITMDGASAPIVV